MCFVTSHLAAFTDKTERRNQDFIELSKRLIFPHTPDPLTQYVSYSWNNGGDEGVSFMENNNVIRDWSTGASIFHNEYSTTSTLMKTMDLIAYYFSKFPSLVWRFEL